MGMYNEVYKVCPECGGQAEAQIGQVVLGFGNFNLDNTSEGDFPSLTTEEKREFAYYVNNSSFYCKNKPDCGVQFRVTVGVAEDKKYEVLI